MSAGILINYIDRVNIAHALVPMAAELKLSKVEQGVVLSAFSWGYVVFMVVGGFLVDRFGPHRAAAAAGAAWSMATAATGASWGLGPLLVSRIALGMGEAPIFPANARLVREEFSPDERGLATAIFDAGSYIGAALAAPLVVFLVFRVGWRVCFVACALLGFLWVLVWCRFAHGLSEGAGARGGHRRRLHLRELLRIARSVKILGASYGFFAYNYSKSFFLTWFPAYLVSERGFSFLQVGLVGVVPPTCAVVGELAAGAWTDRLIRRGVSVTLARKLPLCLGMALAGTVGLTDIATSRWQVVAILSFAFAATIAASPGIWAIPGDLAPSPQHVGTIGGFQNAVANIAGIVAPIATGFLLERTGSFSLALTVSGAVAISGAISYWFVVGELRPIWEEGKVGALEH